MSRSWLLVLSVPLQPQDAVAGHTTRGARRQPRLGPKPTRPQPRTERTARRGQHRRRTAARGDAPRGAYARARAQQAVKRTARPCACARRARCDAHQKLPQRDGNTTRWAAPARCRSPRGRGGRLCAAILVHRDVNYRQVAFGSGLSVVNEPRACLRTPRPARSPPRAEFARARPMARGRAPRRAMRTLTAALRPSPCVPRRLA